MNTSEYPTLPKPSQPKRGPGRPAIITLQLAQKVATLLGKGMPEPLACARVGINYASFRTARHRYPAFETAVKEAQAAYVDAALDRISAGVKGWQGSAWVLERRHPEFRRNLSIDVSQKPVEEMTDAELEQMILQNQGPEALARIRCGELDNG